MLVGYSDISNIKTTIGTIGNEYFVRRTNEYSRLPEKFRTYISYVLLKELAKKYQIDLDNVEIVRDQNGKPYAKNNEFCFNIAHSGNMVVVAIDDENIGVDIEHIRKFDKRIANKFFKDKSNEISLFQNPDIEFTKQWTIFEAQLKYYGSIKLLRQNPTPTIFSENIYDNNQTHYILTIAFQKEINNNIIIEEI